MTPRSPAERGGNLSAEHRALTVFVLILQVAFLFLVRVSKGIPEAPSSRAARILQGCDITGKLALDGSGGTTNPKVGANTFRDSSAAA